MGLGEWLLVFARVAAAVALHPLFGGRSLPRPVAAAVAAALTCSAAGGPPARFDGPPALAAALAGEVALGLAIGLLGQAVFGAIEAAGRFVDDARGAGVAGLFDPLAEAPVSPLGQLDLRAALALFWATGLYQPFVVALAASVDAVPPGSLTRPPAAGESAWLEATLALAGSLARAALALGGPAAACAVAADLLLGIVNRASPQASVFSLGLAVKLPIAAAVTALAAPHRAATWVELWSEHIRQVGRLAGS